MVDGPQYTGPDPEPDWYDLLIVAANIEGNLNEAGLTTGSNPHADDLRELAALLTRRFQTLARCSPEDQQRFTSPSDPFMVAAAAAQATMRRDYLRDTGTA